MKLINISQLCMQQCHFYFLQCISPHLSRENVVSFISAIVVDLCNSFFVEEHYTALVIYITFCGQTFTSWTSNTCWFMMWMSAPLVLVMS